ncbi:LPS-assembly protein LptD [Marinovum algicola]|uniref:LPS-assembly protein LptD n=1 Tax=Marinovum algicola TaxID=42444 RepID=UPI0024BAB1D7|nr:LPS assembly protein LptD [Marinovum algicola]
MLRRLTFALCLALTPLALHAQEAEPDPALLVADTVVVTPDERLIAEGNVEALYDGTRIWARRITYVSETDSLIIEGPIRIDDGESVVILADAAELDSDLENGLLGGARMVLDQQLQLAAVQLARVEGRYTQLSKVTVTSCQICGPKGVPLWSIRARRAIHDEEAQQLYFDGATFRVLDVPVMYIPRLRLPDPTLERARGFLFPSIRTTTELGSGIKLPYFIPLGDHADLTVTPYLSQETRTLELRYRQAFVNGDIELNGALTRDTVLPDETRAYLFGEGVFDLGNRYDLSFNFEVTSDESYLSEYDYSGKDRLDSEVSLSRTTRNTNLLAELVHYNTLRDNELNSTQPTIIPDLRYERRYQMTNGLGGELRLGLLGHSHIRYSESDVRGRDVSRAGAEATWLNQWTFGTGLQMAAQAGLALDQFSTGDDTTVTDVDNSVTPSAALTFRYPFLRSAGGGARQLLEPVAQIGWVGGRDADVANDESTRQELDEGNLLSLSRFPAEDRRERGLASVLGLRFLHKAASGWEAGLAVGRVYRSTRNDDFTATSGLDNAASDWLFATHFRNTDGLYIQSRTLWDEQGEVSKSAARGAWSNDRIDLGASFILLPADTDEDRDEKVAEWTFDGSYRFNRHWTVSGDAQYDIADNRAVEAGLGLAYRNECIEAAFTADRTFADSSNLDPFTTYGLTVTLKGFSTGGDAGSYSRTCKQ